MLIHLFLCHVTECCRHPCCSSGISVRSWVMACWLVQGCPHMVLPAKLASAKCIAVFFLLLFFLFYLFIYLFVVVFFYCLFNWSTEMAVLTWMASSMLSNPNDVFSEIQNMLNAPGWSRRDHADWYTVLTDPDNDDWTTIVIAIPNLFVHQSIYYVMQRFKIIIIIIVYFFTSRDETIHRDLELLTSTSYISVRSGFDPLLKSLGICLPTHHHRECRFAGTVAAVWEYISGTSNGALDLCIYTYSSWQNYF